MTRTEPPYKPFILNPILVKLGFYPILLSPKAKHASTSGPLHLLFPPMRIFCRAYSLTSFKSFT